MSDRVVTKEDMIWVTRLERYYGLSLQAYTGLLLMQGGVCAICGKPETMKDNAGKNTRRLAVDHDSKTGIVRGLLCGHCNMAIGMLDHDEGRLTSAINYLKLDHQERLDKAGHMGANLLHVPYKRRFPAE